MCHHSHQRDRYRHRSVLTLKRLENTFIITHLIQTFRIEGKTIGAQVTKTRNGKINVKKFVHVAYYK